LTCDFWAENAKNNRDGSGIEIEYRDRIKCVAVAALYYLLVDGGQIAEVRELAEGTQLRLPAKSSVCFGTDEVFSRDRDAIVAGSQERTREP
jgi:hypothetical protein